VRKAKSIAPEVSEGIHLNIGCGAKVWPKFINIDFPSNWSGRKPNIECDIREIPLPDNHADSAYAIHVLEHFYRWETESVLTEWIRVLKPGGKLIIEVPCLDKVISIFSRSIALKKEINPQATMYRLYGDPVYKDPVMVHRWCFSVGELIALFEKLGLKEARYEEAEYHSPQCDMRVTGIK
jgi:ubiquinone/menaquinone biosynthesis C-methylase UbiE